MNGENGALVVTLRSCSPATSIDLTMASVDLQMECVLKRCRLTRSASALNGVPSVNFTPLRVCSVHVLPSFDCSHDSTSHGTTLPSVVRRTSGSETWLRMPPLCSPVALWVSKIGTSVGMPMISVSLAAGAVRTTATTMTAASATASHRSWSRVRCRPRRFIPSPLGEVVLGDLERRRHPHVTLAEDQLDEARDHAHARRPADDLRVPHQVEEATFLVHALELFLPDLEHVFLAPDAVADRRHRAEAEEGEVVVAPRGRQLHQLAVHGLVAVRQVGVHEVRVVDEAVFLEQPHRVLRGIRRRHARAERP